MKIYCTQCKKPTVHRQKLHDTVCNKCDRCNLNYPIYLERIHDGRSNVGEKLIWIEWDELGRGKASHDQPQIGYSLCLDPSVIKTELPGLEDYPPIPSHGWMTTTLTSILEDKKYRDYRVIRFTTQNSEYILYTTQI